MVLMNPIFWKLFQTASNLWLQRTTANNLNRLGQKSIVTYVEGVRALRLGTIIFTVFILVSIMAAASVALIIHGVGVLVSLTPEQAAWIEISAASVLLVVSISAVIYLTSESLWIRSFKIDELVNSVDSPDTTDTAAKASQL